MLFIRQLKKENSSQLNELIFQIESSIQNKKWWLPINETSRNHFFDEDWTYFLGLFDNDKLIGASALFFNKHEYGESLSHCKDVKLPVAEIGRCMILPSYRGNNYLHKLNSKLLEIAKKKNISTLLATIHPENKPSQNSFLSLGFKKKAKIIKYNDFERDILLLEL